MGKVRVKSTMDLPADWRPNKRFPLLRFDISPLYAARLASVRPLYTLQPKQRLLLVLENIAGEPVTVPPDSPVGFVRKASVAEVMQAEEEKRQHEEDRADQQAVITEGPEEQANRKKRKRDEEDAGASDDSIEILSVDADADQLERTSCNRESNRTTNTTGDKELGTKNKKQNSKKRKRDEEVAGASDDSINSLRIEEGEADQLERTSCSRESNGTTIRDKKLRAKNKKQNKKKSSRRQMSEKAAQAKAKHSSSNVSCSPDPPGETVAAVAPPAKSVALANDERLVIDTNASFMTSASSLPGITVAAVNARERDSRIVCLAVETASDGAYSQFTQLGAVLSVGGKTSTFGAQVGEVQ